ncbi:hybrid sensor histidine kinase/response regulator [Halobacteriales archaeon QS_8_69_26]|nr:MAG: hybrid sensor histidine kinase/response regulator [Halobacteriales archaeon QS_8_69_26]
MERPAAGGDGIRILCVDDQPGFAKVTADVLEGQRDAFEVVVETDPDEALARVEEDEFDCIVSDYDMPGTDGLSLLEAVREYRPEVPFILFTGKGNEAIASEAISRGVTDYLRKGKGADGYAVLANRIEDAVEEYRSRRSAETAERRMTELTETTDDVLWMFTADWEELLFVNSTYEDIWGRSVDDLRANARDFLQGIHPEDREMVQRAMTRVSEGETVDIEYRVNEAEDYGRWVRVQDRPIRDEDGEIARVAGFARDVTDGWENERTVERERDRFRTLFENLPNPVVHGIAEEGEPVIVDVNPAFEEVFGYDADVVEGEPLDERLVPPGKENEAEMINRRLLTEGEIHTEVRRQTADDVRTFRLDAAIGDPDRDTPEGYAIYTDVTEREEREWELQRRNERLDEFASVVSHDLRTPIEVATGGLELARDDCDSDHLETVQDALDRMTAIVDDTLARQGRTVAEVEPVAVVPLAQRCWDLVATGDATMTATGEFTIRGDPGGVQQVLENLFRNAVEHGDPDGHVRVGPIDERGFYVEDDGPGIPPEEREAVFEAGYTTAADGTVFGLSIVEEVAAAHDWAVELADGTHGGLRVEITGVEFV